MKYWVRILSIVSTLCLLFVVGFVIVGNTGGIVFFSLCFLTLAVLAKMLDGLVAHETAKAVLRDKRNGIER